ncbi:anosmin-1b isoform X1 [Corythoichthys intestinalis]|uniref:anosmin-1b isoform X1 n=1 Tax=Corythoichthys intestinalis TaxID=161448 RepID=UPI0025A62EB2|nr:anosmin-1b isoform X1 [Corythoichthys intestinalis]
MSVRGVVLVVLCAVLLVTRARRSSVEQEDEEKINSARCTSRCLTLHMTQITAAFRHFQSDQVLVWCENQRRCAQCLKPCKELWETKKKHSLKSCEKQTECVTSSEFLTSLRSSRQGDCPQPQRATGFAAACVESCSLDRHCPFPRKCCFNGCGHTCQTPANLYKGVPLKPRRDMSFMEDPVGRVKVMWVSKFNVSIEPVVYVLQSRWNTGIHPSEDNASPWITVAMTLSEDALLSDLRPQRWYQFRVAAVNSQGSRGFTTPSKHHISNKDPSIPGPPINIRVSNQTLVQITSQAGSHFTGSRARGIGITVAVYIHWDPPQEGDLPVQNYRVTWMSRHRTQNITHPTQENKHELHKNLHTRFIQPQVHQQSKKGSNSRVTQGVQCELWLHGLLPDTFYVLSVQSVAYWGQKRLKSPRAHTVFTTMSYKGEDLSNELPSASSSLSPSQPLSPSLSSSSFSSSSPDLPLFSSLPHPESPLDHAVPSDLRLEVAAPHYHNGQLQVKAFWKRSNHARNRHPGPYILRWRPHTCSTNVTGTEGTANVQGTHYTITGLLFACKYWVAVAMTTDAELEAVAWVTTPTCSSIRVKGDKTLPCSTEERPLAGRKVILRPERLTAKFQHVNGTLLAFFRWRVSQHALDLAEVQGFQFTWTLQSDVTLVAKGQEDTLISQTQTIAPSQRAVIIHGLQSDSAYKVQLQVLTPGGNNGAAVFKTFHTPVL